MTFSAAKTVMTAERRKNGRKQNNIGKACDYYGKLVYVTKNCWPLKKNVCNGYVKEESSINIVYDDLGLIESY